MVSTSWRHRNSQCIAMRLSPASKMRVTSSTATVTKQLERQEIGFLCQNNLHLVDVGFVIYRRSHGRERRGDVEFGLDSRSPSRCRLPSRKLCMSCWTKPMQFGDSFGKRGPRVCHTCREERKKRTTTRAEGIADGFEELRNNFDPPCVQTL